MSILSWGKVVGWKNHKMVNGMNCVCGRIVVVVVVKIVKMKVKIL